MVETFQPVLNEWRRRADSPTGVGIGVASGEAIIGNIGSPHYMNYTIIGDAVNTAARLMQQAKAGELLMSGAVYDAVAGLVPRERMESRGSVALRGKSEPTRVYSVQLGAG
jgi:adenylate cyclase